VAEQMPDRPTGEHPIAAGVVALVGVAVVVGLILGLVVLAGSRLLGLGGEDGTSEAGSKPSMYLPRPVKTPVATDPQITLAPGESSSPRRSPSQKPSESKPASRRITLSASTTSTGPMEPFDLTGVYPGGEGAILQIQRFQNGRWEDFPVTASVGNETFQSPVQTSQAGVNRFRVVDTDTQLRSNEVRVTVG
jgi:hypothetical protein